MCPQKQTGYQLRIEWGEEQWGQGKIFNNCGTGLEEGGPQEEKLRRFAEIYRGKPCSKRKWEEFSFVDVAESEEI